MTNVYDKAHEMQKVLGESEEFRNLKEKYQAVLDDTETSALFEKFRKMQMAFQQMMMKGEDIPDYEQMQSQVVFEQVRSNEKINDLMKAEERVNVVITDINKIIMSPLENLYGAVM